MTDENIKNIDPFVEKFIYGCCNEWNSTYQ